MLIIVIDKDFAAKYWSNQVFSAQSLLESLLICCLWNRSMLHSQKALVGDEMVVLTKSISMYCYKF